MAKITHSPETPDIQEEDSVLCVQAHLIHQVLENGLLVGHIASTQAEEN